jgi:hypothetical protein
MHPVLAEISIAELEAVIAERRRSHIETLKRRRLELQSHLRQLDEAIADALGRKAPADAAPASREAPSLKAAKRGLPIGTMVLKAIAARHPRQTCAQDLVADLKNRLPDDKPISLVQRMLARMKTSGLLDSHDDEYYMLTPRGISRAGGA